MATLLIYFIFTSLSTETENLLNTHEVVPIIRVAPQLYIIPGGVCTISIAQREQYFAILLHVV